VDRRTHFLEDLNVSFLIESSILPSLTEFPKFKISGEMKRLHMNLLDANYVVVKKILSNVLNALEPISSPAVSAYESPIINRVEESFAAETFQDFDSNVDEFEDAREYLESVGSSPERQLKVTDSKQINTLFSFYASEASITLMSQQHDEEFEILSELIITDASIESTSYLYDSILNFKISNIQMTNGAAKDDLILSKTIGSQREVSLLDMSYKLFGRNSPDYTGDDSILCLQVDSLTLKLTAEPILKLYKLFMDLFEGPVPSTTVESDATLSVSQSNFNSKMNFILNRMVIQLFDQSCFAAANFDTMYLAVETSSAIQKINGKIGKFTIDDLSALDNQFRDFLKVEADQLIDFNLVSEVTSNGGYDSTFDLSASSARFFYNPIFNGRFFAYLAKFQSMYSLMENARNSAIQSATAIKNQSDRFSYHIQCETPIIIMPGRFFSGNPTSHDFWLYLYPGRMVLQNDLASDDVFVSLYDIKVCSLKLSSKVQQNIVEQFNLAVRSFAVNIAEGKTNCMSADIDDIKLVVDQEQYDFLVEIYQFMTSGESQDSEESPPDYHEKSVLKSESKLPIYKTNSVDLKFGDISLCAVEISANRELLFEIILENTRIKYAYFTDTSSEASILIRNAILYNRKSSRLLFQEVINSKKSDDNDQLSIKYDAPRIGSSKYLIQWDGLILLLELDFIYRVSHFFSKPWSSPSINIEYSVSPYVVTYEFNINGSEVLMLDTVNKSDSEAIILKSENISVVMNAITTIKLQQMTFLLTGMNLRENISVTLVEPFNSMITMDTHVISKNEQATNVNVDIDPLTAFLAFSDMSMIYRILEKNLTNTGSFPENLNQQVSTVVFSEKVFLVTLNFSCIVIWL
jgi:vacuolar protein sorting-associated protein 13A/C